jgi:hypothetical protein
MTLATTVVLYSADYKDGKKSEKSKDETLLTVDFGLFNTHRSFGIIFNRGYCRRLEEST